MTQLYIAVNPCWFLNDPTFPVDSGGPNVDAALDAMIAMFAAEGRANVPKLALLVLEGNVVLDDALTNKIQQVKDASRCSW